jgi:outer membrane immunogenic protein
MKKFLLGTVALVALGLAGPASAADLAARPYTKAPAPMIAAYDWSGFYIGGNGGWGSSRKCWDNSVFFGVAIVPTFAEGCHDANGAVAGGQIGYRWQASSWVFGLEAQGDWADLKGSNVSRGFFLVPGDTTNQSRIDSFGLFTGQVGFSFANAFLLYVKGGAAVTHDKYDGFVLGFAGDRASETRWGAAVGVGGEYAFSPNWSLGLEYDHLFMGNRDVTFATLGAVPVASRTDRIRQDVDLVTLRLNYRFGGPMVSRY